MDVQELARSILSGGQQFKQNLQRGLQDPRGEAVHMQNYIQENPMAVAGMTAPVGEFKRFVRPESFNKALETLTGKTGASLNDVMRAQDVYGRVVKEQLIPEEIAKLSKKPDKMIALIQKRLAEYSK